MDSFLGALAESLRVLLPFAAEHRIIIALENMLPARGRVSPPSRSTSSGSAASSRTPPLGFCLDTGHALVAGRTRGGACALRVHGPAARRVPPLGHRRRSRHAHRPGERARGLDAPVPVGRPLGLQPAHVHRDRPPSRTPRASTYPWRRGASTWRAWSGLRDWRSPRCPLPEEDEVLHDPVGRGDRGGAHEPEARPLEALADALGRAADRGTPRRARSGGAGRRGSARRPRRSPPRCRPRRS